MKPSAAIAMLDRQLAAHGQTITLRRGTKSAPSALITVKGFPRGFTSDEIVPGSGISQNDDKVILSPSSLAAWPDPAPGEDDWCEIDGVFRSVIKGRVRKIDDVVVRIELQVKG